MAQTVIDALVVTLGLDPKAYQKGRKDVSAGMKDLRQQSAKTAKEMEEQGKKAAEFFSSVRTELLALLAAVGAATSIKDFIGSTTTGLANLGLESKNLGMSAKHLDAWKTAAKEMGGSGKDAIGALQAVAGGMAEAAIKGQSAFTNTLRANRIAIHQGESYSDILMSISQRMHQLPAQQALWLANQLGVGSLFNVLYNMRDLHGDIAENMKRSGATEQNTAQALRIQKAWVDMLGDVHKAMDSFYTAIEPMLTQLGEQFVRWLDGVHWGRIADQVQQLAERLVAFVRSINWDRVRQQFMDVGRAIFRWIVSVDWKGVIRNVRDFANAVINLVADLGGFKAIAIALAAILGLRLLSPVLAVGRGILSLGGMAVTATTGITGLAAAFSSLGVAIAAAGGALIGSELWKHLLEGTKAGDKIGEAVTSILASLGYKPAQEALRRMQNAPDLTAPTDVHNVSVLRSKGYHPEKTAYYQSKFNDAVRYFVGAGFTRDQAIGMAANIASESTFDAQAVGDKGKAYGIGQWHPDRQATFAKVMGKPIQGSSYKDQLEFYAWEVSHNRALMKRFSMNPNAGASAFFVSTLSERPAGGQAEAQRRMELADQWSKSHYIGATRVAAAQSPVSNSTSTSSSQVNINGPITVTTQATDAQGVARGLGKALQDYPLIQQANTGLN